MLGGSLRLPSAGRVPGLLVLVCALLATGCGADEADPAQSGGNASADVGISFGGNEVGGGSSADTGQAANPADTSLADGVSADASQLDTALDSSEDDSADALEDSSEDTLDGGASGGADVLGGIDTGGAGSTDTLGATPDTTQDTGLGSQDTSSNGPDTYADAGNPGDACACDDGDACTKDTCDKGVCSHVMTVDCSPMDGPCIAGVCQAGKCVPAAKSDGGPCDDGDACSVQDSCLGGQCFGKAKDCSAKDGPCTTGTCDSGTCSAKSKATGSTCSDGDLCTVGDACYGGICSAKPLDCSAQASACTLASCKAGKCVTSSVKSGTACQDGSACTTSDVCNGKGSCIGKVKNCSAKNGVCVTGACLNGICIAKPKSNGTACSDGDACTLSDACKSGACVGKTKSDAYESNNSAPGKSLGSKSDCDPNAKIVANISPKTDVDWYTFSVKDKSFCTLQPEVTISGITSDLEMCIFFKCGNGKTGSGTVTCAAGTINNGGPGGAYGCCSNNSGKQSEFAKIKPKCSTFAAGDDSGTVWVRVRAKAGYACSNYTLTWGAAK